MLDWDEQDQRNNGVISDEFVSCFSGVMLRRVRYRDAVTKSEFAFITNELNLPPGLIAFIYKSRWNIEKVFDEKKNKLRENKAWATSPEAQTQQALFVCLTHNLMVLFEQALKKEEGIKDQKLEDRRSKERVRIEEELKQRSATPNPLLFLCTRVSQRSLQFIRWLRHHLEHSTSWREAVGLLRPFMAKYIS